MTSSLQSKSTSETAALLGATDLFADQEEELRREFAGRCERVYLAPGECLMREGDPADCLYILVSGRLRVQVRQLDGVDTTVKPTHGTEAGEAATTGTAAADADGVVDMDTVESSGDNAEGGAAAESDAMDTSDETARPQSAADRWGQLRGPRRCVAAGGLFSSTPRSSEAECGGSVEGTGASDGRLCPSDGWLA